MERCNGIGKINFIKFGLLQISKSLHFLPSRTNDGNIITTTFHVFQLAMQEVGTK